MSADKKPLVVVADDDPDVTALLARTVAGWGYRVGTARNKSDLLAALAHERPALVLLDLRLGDADGLEVLRQLQEMTPGLPIAPLTAHGSIDAAVTAMRLGAYDFLTKPPDLNRLRILVGHAAEKQRLDARIKKLESLVEAGPAGVRLVGDSPPMQRAVSLLRSVAPTDATVLVLGESGTGKELAARTVHELSRRKDGPFVPLNMAALPRELAESLLFGHEKGAFTGADRSQPGACELADGGTLFLDEMGEMDLALQAKLLRFLQERTVQRVGNPKPTTVDVRVVAATNRDLAERVRAGQFREDLYYRLNVVPVTLPPLRDRREDVPALAARFLRKAALKYGRDDMHLTPEAVDRLVAYDWPGNVRQLENLIERAAILSPGGAVGPEAFADEFRSHAASPATLAFTPAPVGLSRPTPLGVPYPPPMVKPVGGDGPTLMEQVERQTIVDALARSGGSVREASFVLGLSQATVYRKLKRYNLSLEEFARPAG